MSTHLIIGLGEVGTALANVLSEVHDVSALDIKDEKTRPANGAHFDMAHVCFSYSEHFEAQVQRYQRAYSIDVLVIHSTVPVGTSRNLGAAHSPVMGRHPHLEGDLLTITKFIGGTLSVPVAHAFRRAGMDVYLFDQPETCELLKLFSTLYFGVCVEFTREVWQHCKMHGVPFEAWTLWTNAYNNAMLGTEMQRPNVALIPGPLGGHCVLSNADMIDSEFADLVKRRNE